MLYWVFVGMIRSMDIGILLVISAVRCADSQSIYQHINIPLDIYYKDWMDLKAMKSC